MTRDAGHQAERRRQILAAAERVFDANGYAGTTVDAVAAAAGISKGSIYNYFKSKDDLFQAIFANVMSDAQSQVDRRFARAASASRKLEELLDYRFDTLTHHNRIGRLVLEFWATAARQQRQGQLNQRFREMYGWAHERVRDVLAQGIADGEFRQEVNTAVAASLILAILDGIEIQSILEMGINVDAEFMTALKRAVLAGLSTAGGDRK